MGNKLKKILVLGAGLSATSLINYLLNNSTIYNWQVTVGDLSEETAALKINKHPNGRAIKFLVEDRMQAATEIADCDLVISLLPAFFHPVIAEICLEKNKHLVTASYVSDQMASLNQIAIQKGLIFVNEAGLDPGIDHMSAMEVIDKIKLQGGTIYSFKSYTGGLIAPKSDTNPWNYKFTWNPRNVVVAGQGIAKYITKGKYKYIPYNRLFTHTEKIGIANYGNFEGYPNRDSLKYREIYGLGAIPTMIRGTLRRPGFCKAWNVFVQLGLTDDSYTIENSDEMTYREFVNSFLPFHEIYKVEEKLAELVGVTVDSETLNRLKWLGIFGNTRITMKNATPAQILQKILSDKLFLETTDTDMIVMQHQFEYEIKNVHKRIISSLVVEGTDHLNTAMSITVGTPVAIVAKLILNEQFTTPGVHIPVIPQLYKPILNELKMFGVNFTEQEITL